MVLWNKLTAEDILNRTSNPYVEALLIKGPKKSIITAESLMFKKMTLVQIAKDGPGSSVNA
jgi:glycine betaine/proline transport system ATP-binding protein